MSDYYYHYCYRSPAQKMNQVHFSEPFFLLFKKSCEKDFPGVAVVKNLSSNARDICSIPGWGIKIPHASGQLSLRAANTDPAAATREPMRLNERSRVLS